MATTASRRALSANKAEGGVSHSSSTPSGQGPSSRPSLARRLDKGVQLTLESMAGVILFALMAVTTVDVVGRFFFNSPLTGSVELTQLMLAAVVFLAMPVVSWREEHVSVDLLDTVFPARWVWLRQLAINLLVAAALWIVAGRVWALGVRSLEWGDVTEFLRLPIGYLIYLIAAMLFVSAVLAALRGLGYLLEGVGVIPRGGPLSVARPPSPSTATPGEPHD